MKQLEERFNQIMEGVRVQSKSNEHSSIIKTDFAAYKYLKSIGLPALPYLRRLIGNENEPRWEILLATRDIIQDSGKHFMFPSEMRGNLARLEDYMKGYLDCRLPQF